MFKLYIKEIDLAPYWFQPVTELGNHIELDLFVWSSQIVILQRWPEEESRLKAPIRPFSPMVIVAYRSIKKFILLIYYDL